MKLTSRLSLIIREPDPLPADLSPDRTQNCGNASWTWTLQPGVNWF